MSLLTLTIGRSRPAAQPGESLTGELDQPSSIAAMRLRFAALGAAGALALAAVAGAAPGFKATFSAPTHTPKVNAKWFYVVRATGPAGTPIRATVTAQLVDPFGGVHAVQFGSTTKPIVNRPFVGAFRDFVQFPPESQGFKLTFRVTVNALGARRVLSYWIKAR
jgi:hypothetical protein